MKLSEVIDQFLIDCKIRGLTPETLSWYRRTLHLFSMKLEILCKVTDLESVKIAHLRQFVQLLMSTRADENNPRKPVGNKPLSAFTIRGYVRAIKVLFTWCVNEELLEKTPASRLIQPKAPVYLIPTFTIEHVETMLATCDQKTPDGFRNYVLLLVLLDTGMRASELCGLRVGDVHVAGSSGEAYVRVFGKGRKEREIGLHPEVGKLLCNYIHTYRKPADHGETTLFIGRLGEPLRYGGVKSILEDVKTKSGIEGVRISAHTFRHTFAKFYLLRGGEVFKLSLEMGHSTVQVTEMYLKDIRSSEARREHTKFSPIGGINLKGDKENSEAAENQDETFAVLKSK